MSDNTDAVVFADAHCARARAAGDEIISEPRDHTPQERGYVVADLEGHIWSFGQRKAPRPGSRP